MSKFSVGLALASGTKPEIFGSRVLERLNRPRCHALGFTSAPSSGSCLRRSGLEVSDLGFFSADFGLEDC